MVGIDRIGCRLDRLATLSLFYPLSCAIGLGRGNIPILMYHSISAEEEFRGHWYYRINTTPEVFADHMLNLAHNGYSVVRLCDVVSHFATGSELPTKPVVLTFDDGYEDFYTHAFPILRKYGFTATVFLATDYVGNIFKLKNCMNWTQLRNLSKEGINFGSHTVTHPELNYMGTDELYYELNSSKKTIEDNIGVSADSFSYPFAFPEADYKFKAILKHTLVECGYTHGVTTNIGTIDTPNDLFFLKRIPVNTYDDTVFFKAKLNRGYDWMYKLQYMSKLLKSLLC
jgi:peptidoglycan/xylan/chitin deacetylase (PgdA/CDA1 family)